MVVGRGTAMGMLGAYRWIRTLITRARMPVTLTVPTTGKGAGMAFPLRYLLRGFIALAGAVLLFLALAVAHPLGASAATVTVTTTGDTTNTCATDGTTAPCSLRDAVTYANKNDSTTITFDLPNPSTITLTGGRLTLTRTTGSGTT